MKTNNTTTALLAAIGERGTEATLAAIDFDAIKAQIGGTVNAVRLDKSDVAVFYNRDAQTAMVIDGYDLQGTLALCGIDKSGNPVSLATVKQVTKYAKVFKAQPKSSGQLNITDGKEVK